jgi:hypothetical protein
VNWPDQSGDVVATAEAPAAESSSEPGSRNHFVVVLPGSDVPPIDIRWRFWRRPLITVHGRELPHRGRLRWRRELVTLPDGSQAELRLAGFFNRAVVIDGQRHPLERRLRVWELALVALPLLAIIPGPYGVGAIPILVGLGGCRINTVLTRSTRRASGRGAVMLGVSVAAIAVAFAVNALGVFVLGERGTSDRTATLTETTWPYHAGECLDGPRSERAALDQYKVVDCSNPHFGEVIGTPRDPVAAFPGEAALDQFAERACGTAFSSYAGRPFDEHHDGYIWFEPSAFGFDVLHGAVLCIGTSADGTQLTGSLVG